MHSQAIFRRFCTLPLVAAAFVWLAAVGPAHAITINVSAGQNLNQIMEDANDGDLILVGPGTYTAQATTYVGAGPFQFRIRKELTVRSTGGPGVTTLVGGTGADYAVYFHSMTWGAPGPVIKHEPHNSTLEGFTIQGSNGGVEVQHNNPSPSVLNNVTLKNLVIRANRSANGSHGVSFSAVTNGRIDSVTVECNGSFCPYNNGIYVFQGSDNTVINNTVQGTMTQHAIGISSTTRALVSGNTVTGSAFHAIIALATTDSRIERNTLSGYTYDAVTFTNTGASLSSSNFIGHNRGVSNGWPGGVVSDGTGIWLNGDANGHLVFGNDVRGSPENGVAVFASSSNMIQANRIHGNYQGGVLIWNYTALSGGVGGQPQNNIVRSNFIYYNPTNAMVNLRDTLNTDVSFNYFSGNNFPGDAANPANKPPAAGGGPVVSSPGGVSVAGYPAANTAVYGNGMTGLTNAIYFDNGVTQASVYRNRFFGTAPGTGTMDFYSITPATVSWDAGATMGGNHFEGHTANGNPSNGSTPFTNIFCPTEVGCTYKDNYPFALANFGQSASVTVLLPRPGSQVAPSSKRTIEWDSRGCSLVDIHLMNGGTAVTTIATNYPDIGYYIWDVASGESSGTRAVRVTCKDNVGNSTGATGTGGTFTVAPSGLVLLAPGPFAAGTSGSTMTVAWARNSGATGAVSVFLQVDGAAETTAASGITDNVATITLPAATNSNRVTIRIATGSQMDSTDGYFRIVNNSSHGVTGISAGQNLVYGTRHKIEWKSFTGSRYVDIEVGSGGTFQFIAQNVPDFGYYDWLVPASQIGSNRQVRLTFKSTTTSAVIGPVTSNAFNVTAPAVLSGPDLSVNQSVSPNPASVLKDIMFTTTVSNGGPDAASNVVFTNTMPSGASYIWATAGCGVSGGTVTCNLGSMAVGASRIIKVVVRPNSTGTATNTVSVAASETDPSSGNNSSSVGVTVNSNPAATQVLRYRLYSDVTKEHHFTTDLNEYTVLGGNGNWVQEGTVGKVLSQPGSFGGVQATPYYRLYDTATRWHHWTTDANEYYTLIEFPNWNAEGVDGYILPTQGTGSIPLYRLLYPFIPGLHHWTIDTNEYNTLISTYGWIGEGGSGFVIP
jgi:uncharacterized repeat protein (TIGR01451 family)